MPILGSRMTKVTLPRTGRLARTQPVHSLRSGAVIALVGLFGAQGAIGDTWDAFLTRCFVPFAEFSDPITADLVEQNATVSDQIRIAQSDEVRAFELPGGARLFTSDTDGDDYTRACGVRSSGHADAGLNGFGVWRNAQLAQGLFEEEAGRTPRNGRYLSNDWIEPRLRVSYSISTHGGPVTYLIVETNLES